MRRAALLLLVLLAPLPAFAIDQTQPDVGSSSQKTTADLLGDLHSDGGPDRLYAARALRSQLKRALRVEANGREGSIPLDDARSLLVELEERLPPICTDALDSPQVAAPCAEMLAMLDVEEAAPAIERALQAETRKRPRRRLERALAALQHP
jgi:hypothetical protein